MLEAACAVTLDDMGDDLPAEALSRHDLDQIRQAVRDWLPQHLHGTPTTMRVVATTTRPAVRVAIEAALRARRGGPEPPPLPDDARPVYLAVLEGEFQIRPPSNRPGCWVAVYVTPTFDVQGFQLAPHELIPPRALTDLGQVSQLEP